MLYIGAAGIKGGLGDQRLLSARLSVCEGEASSKTTTQTLNTTNPTGLCVNQPVLSWGLKNDSREESSEPGWEEKTEKNKQRYTNLTLLAPNVYVLALCF